MKLVVVFAVCFMAATYVRATREDIINAAVAAIDSNGDGIVTLTELHTEFVDGIDTNNDFLVSEAEFMSTTTGWPSISGDTVANAQAFFDNLDVVCSWWTLWNWNDCDVLGPADLVVLVFQMDNSPRNGEVTTSELQAWLDQHYP